MQFGASNDVTADACTSTVNSLSMVGDKIYAAGAFVGQTSWHGYQKTSLTSSYSDAYLIAINVSSTTASWIFSEGGSGADYLYHLQASEEAVNGISQTYLYMVGSFQQSTSLAFTNDAPLSAHSCSGADTQLFRGSATFK